MSQKLSRSYRVFLVLNNIGVGFLAFLCVAPLIHVLAVSFSGSAAANSGLVGFWPIEFNTRAYELTMQNRDFFRSFNISVFRVVAGVSLGMFITILSAYPLSKEEEEFRGRGIYVWAFVVTMLFSGGMIPTYIVVKQVGLLNSFWAMILPGLVSVGNVILMLNFFRSIPTALGEAAFIDGAGHMTTLLRIYVPMSLPSFATIALFLIVGHWNEWFSGMIYISDAGKQPMATYLRQFLARVDVNSMALADDDVEKLSDRALRFAQIFISLIPIMVVYPVM